MDAGRRFYFPVLAGLAFKAGSRPAQAEKLSRNLAVKILAKLDVTVGDRARAVHDRKPNNRRGKIGRRFERVADVIRGPRQHRLLRRRLN